MFSDDSGLIVLIVLLGRLEPSRRIVVFVSGNYKDPAVGLYKVAALRIIRYYVRTIEEGVFRSEA